MGDDEILMAQQEMDMEDTFEKRFGWYVVLNKITNNEITKHDEVLQKKIIEIMNQLVYIVEYDKEQIRLQKKAMGHIS